MGIDHILVAIDGSEAAARALAMAANLAAKLSARMTIAHVLPTYEGPPDSNFEPFERAAEAYAQQLLTSGIRSSGLPVDRVETAVLRGDSASAVADCADRVKADLVVVGSRGRGTVTRMLMGSVSDRLVHICNLPVLVVR